MNQRGMKRTFRQRDFLPQYEQDFNMISLRSMSMPFNNSFYDQSECDLEQDPINQSNDDDNQLYEMSKIIQKLMEEIEILKNEQVTSDKMEKIIQENLGLKIQLQTSQCQLKIIHETIAESQNEINEVKKQQIQKENENQKLREQNELLQKALGETQNIIEKYDQQLKEVSSISQQEIQYLKNQMDELKLSQQTEIQKIKDLYEKKMIQAEQKNASLIEHHQNQSKSREQELLECKQIHKLQIENINRQFEQLIQEKNEQQRQISILQFQNAGISNRQAHSFSPLQVNSRPISRRIFEEKENFNKFQTENSFILSNQVNVSQISTKSTKQQNLKISLEKPGQINISQVSLKSNNSQNLNTSFEKIQRPNISPQNHITQPLQKLMAFRLRMP